jgi:hypothetical protein
MTKFALLGAAALQSAMAVTPVTAQEVIYNPGYCAQFYPNANCQNKGPNNPNRWRLKSTGGLYSLAIPISLITRPYLVS